MLNDSSEFHFGLDRLQRTWNTDQVSLISKLPENLRPRDPIVVEQLTALLKQLKAGLDSSVFVACASLAGNSLSQWRSYGNSGGFAIGLPMEMEFGVCGSANPLPWQVKFEDGDVDGIVRSAKWRGVYYRKREQEEFARSSLLPIVGLLGQDHINPTIRLEAARVQLIETALYLKHPSFRDEKEFRVVFGGNSLHPFTKYRSSKFGLTSYIEISSHDNHGKVENVGQPKYITCGPTPVLPVRAIWIGPQTHARAVEKEVAGYLKRLNLHEVQMHFSRIPLR